MCYTKGFFLFFFLFFSFFPTPPPLILIYIKGHFSVLVGFVDPEAPDLLSFPLCDEKFIPLPVHFLEGGGEGGGKRGMTRSEALKLYTRNYQVLEVKKEGEGGERGGERFLVEVCDQLHPLGEWVRVGEVPDYSDCFEGMRENLAQLLNPGEFYFYFLNVYQFMECVMHVLFSDYFEGYVGYSFISNM